MNPISEKKRFKDSLVQAITQYSEVQDGCRNRYWFIKKECMCHVLRPLFRFIWHLVESRSLSVLQTKHSCFCKRDRLLLDLNGKQFSLHYEKCGGKYDQQWQFPGTQNDFYFSSNCVCIATQRSGSYYAAETTFNLFYFTHATSISSGLIGWRERPFNNVL